MAQRFDSVAAVLAAVGCELGATEWMRLTQERINLFAEATDDHQWIHVDEVRAAEGPYGGCIAHGYLTLSLANKFLPELVEYDGLKMGVNYGCERVRFPSPARAGVRLRGCGKVVAAEEMKDGGVQVTIRVTVEIEDGGKPACVVDTISRLYFQS